MSIPVAMDEQPADGEGQASMLDRVLQLERQVGTLSTLFSMASAERMGLNLTDMIGLSLLEEAGPITHGELATLIGLSGGAVTGLVDRLERMGLVRRERDANDRRRVLLHVDRERAGEIGSIFAPMQAASRENLRQFTGDELEVITRYNGMIARFMRDAARTMRAGAKAGTAKT